MVDLEQEQNTSDMSAKKKELISTAMERTTEWIFSQEIPSDLTVNAGGTSFSLHKFPLVTKCGYMMQKLSESDHTDHSTVEIPDIPGGGEAFELAAKFCYGINFEITTENIAMLRCAAEYLEMTEEHSVGNLISRTESYINQVALKSLSGAISILHSSENLLPIAEKVRLVSRSIDTISTVACKDSHFCAPIRSDSGLNDLIPSPGHSSKPVVDWWAEDLAVLRIDMFQRVLMAMMARGFKQYALAPILMIYAEKSLLGLEIFGKGRKKIQPKQEHEKRVVLETIVSLLPRGKNVMSVSFLSMLLRASICLETTVSCRLDLEKRMASQLGQAVLDDLLIPSHLFTGDTLLDVETVQRITTYFFEFEREVNKTGYNADEHTSPPSANDMERVTRLMEGYLSEVASDRNLSVLKFVSLAELIPEQFRITDDSMYRAIDIFLKDLHQRLLFISSRATQIFQQSNNLNIWFRLLCNIDSHTRRSSCKQLQLLAHPGSSDMEKKKVCSIMDCQKLSREACAHAAQNDRLPVQTVVQVLYYEQQRLREATDGCQSTESPTLLATLNPSTIDIHPVGDQASSLRRENQDLKQELVKMKMRLDEMEKSSNSTTPAVVSPVVISRAASGEKKPSFVGSVSRKLGRFIRMDGIIPSWKGRNRPSKDRRHSIS
ncbi:BTB/POZ domain-containing protein SR1IP1 isoform X1 [Primulina eburnea]|uniref:BTB/POZ domain-containing protein SR1IP1 isoform X1 n=1 Tax=Primulina eburnea TaxID=1245227 RepID=UPI003C6BD8FD